MKASLIASLTLNFVLLSVLGLWQFGNEAKTETASVEPTRTLVDHRTPAERPGDEKVQEYQWSKY